MRSCPVPRYEGLYEVSETGEVRSLARVVQSRRWGTQKINGRRLSVDLDRHGHQRVRLSKNGKEKRFQVHRLVLLVFVGPCPDGYEARHLDGNTSNNSLSNLCWGTAKENWNDRYRHGTAVATTPKHNSSGMRGVYFYKHLGKWQAYIGYQPRKSLGFFDTFEQACAARLVAEACWQGSRKAA